MIERVAFATLFLYHYIMRKSVIYLDIDGVLATHKQYLIKKTSTSYLSEYNCYPYDGRCVKIFNDILEETDAEIILSSDWSLYYTLEQMDEIFKINGIIKSPYQIAHPKAFRLSANAALNRGFSIDEHLFFHQHEFSNYVIIDDLDITCYNDSWSQERTVNYDNFVHCSRGDFEGIKQTEIKDKILKVLNKREL